MISIQTKLCRLFFVTKTGKLLTCHHSTPSLPIPGDLKTLNSQIKKYIISVDRKLTMNRNSISKINCTIFLCGMVIYQMNKHAVIFIGF